MNIEDIIHKKSPARVSVSEMSYVIKEYIREKTGKGIEVNLEKGLDRRHPLFTPVYQQQLSKLSNAFTIASEYFINKK